MRRTVRLRGALALTVLLSLATSSAEAVAGDVRDGAEHHESVVAALEHRAVQGLEHQHLSESGSPDGSGAPAQVPTGEHQHPGGSDHCGHLHGVGIPPTLSLAFPASVTHMPSVTPGEASSFSPAVQPRPPKA